MARGASQIVEGERELAVQMARYTLRRFGVTSRELEAIAQGSVAARNQRQPADLDPTLGCAQAAHLHVPGVTSPYSGEI